MLPVRHSPPTASPSFPRSPDNQPGPHAIVPGAPGRTPVTGVRRRAEQALDEPFGRRLRVDDAPHVLAPAFATGPASTVSRLGAVRVAPSPVVRWEQDTCDDEPFELAHGQSICLVDRDQMLMQRARLARADEGLVTVLATDRADGVFSRCFHTDVAAIFRNDRGIGLAHLSFDKQELPRAILRAHAEFFAATGAPAEVILGYFPESYRPALMEDAQGQSPAQLRASYAGAFDASRLRQDVDDATFRARVVDLVIERDVQDIIRVASRAQRQGGPEFEITLTPMAGTMVAVGTDGSLHGRGHPAA